jgi:hypothetical protein
MRSVREPPNDKYNSTKQKTKIEQKRTQEIIAANEQLSSRSVKLGHYHVIINFFYSK